MNALNEIMLCNDKAIHLWLLHQYGEAMRSWNHCMRMTRRLEVQPALPQKRAPSQQVQAMTVSSHHFFCSLQGPQNAATVASILLLNMSTAQNLAGNHARSTQIASMAHAAAQKQDNQEVMNVVLQLINLSQSATPNKGAEDRYVEWKRLLLNASKLPASAA